MKNYQFFVKPTSKEEPLHIKSKEEPLDIKEEPLDIKNVS